MNNPYDITLPQAPMSIMHKQKLELCNNLKWQDIQEVFAATQGLNDAMNKFATDIFLARKS